MELFEMTALELSRRLQKKEVSAVEVAKSFIERTEHVEPLVQAYITLTPELALATAQTVDEKRGRDEKLHLLAGVPLAVKDNICTHGVRTTCASLLLKDFIPPKGATVVNITHDAGMPIIGKTNLDEFAMGASTENSAFFPTRNPWDLARVPGGSSGGSAAAVSAGMAPLALGSDTGGSVRQPAAFCGLVGLRPTYGRVSCAGLIPLASSLDQVGTFSLTVADAALLLRLIAGRDQADATSSSQPAFDYFSTLQKGVNGLRIGLLAENIPNSFDAEIIAAVHKAALSLEESGAVVEEISLPHINSSIEVYHLLCSAEASYHLDYLDSIGFDLNAAGYKTDKACSQLRSNGFGSEVKRRILLGKYILRENQYEALYVQAMRVRTLIRRDYKTSFKRFNLLLGAVTPTTAFVLGEKNNSHVSNYHDDICTLPGPLAGVPSISIPYGLSSAGLPIGVQLTAPPSFEEMLFRAAYYLEQSRGYQPQRPRLLSPMV